MNCTTNLAPILPRTQIKFTFVRSSFIRTWRACLLLKKYQITDKANSPCRQTGSINIEYIILENIIFARQAIALLTPINNQVPDFLHS